MTIEKRKVYIEFTSSDTCILTTPFLQKEIKLEDGSIIDLVTLKRVKDEADFDYFHNPSCSFFGCVVEESENKHELSHMVLEIYALIQPSTVRMWNDVSIYHNNKTSTEGSIYVND